MFATVCFCLYVCINPWLRAFLCMSFRCSYMRPLNKEGSQFPKFHFLCNKEERLVLNLFFKEYNLYST